MNHTAEEVRANVAENRRHMTTATDAQLTAYAAVLERREAGVTDFVRDCAITAFNLHPGPGEPLSVKEHGESMRAALLAVWPVAAEPAQAAHFDKRRFEEAPCYLCGYNGPGYYRPNIHPCAKQYHTPTAKPAQPADSGRVADALRTIKYSIQQARILGNDWKRELQLIENAVDVALAAQGQPAEHVPEVVTEVLAELDRAMRKFPTWPTDPLHALAVLGEEYGELNKAVLQQVYEPAKNPLGAVHSEAVQAAAMALRFIASIDEYAWLRSVQHEQPMLAAPSAPKGE